MFQCEQYLHSGRYPALPKFARTLHPKKLHSRHQRDLLLAGLAEAEEPLAGGEPLRRGGQRAVQADRHQEHPSAAEAGQRGRDIRGDGRGHETRTGS